MNPNAQLLHDDLAASKLVKFDMHDVQSCGSPRCILGHAVARKDGSEGLKSLMETAINGAHMSFKTVPQVLETYKWLGLTPEIGNALCFPNASPLSEVVWDRDDEVLVDHPWLRSPYASTQPEAAAALARACELMPPEEEVAE